MGDIGGWSGFKVDPAELRGCAGSAAQLAGQIPGETGRITGPSDQASGKLPGWAAAGALHDCTNAWKVVLDRLSTDMDTYSTKLVAVAQNYEDNDAATAARLNEAILGPAGAGPAAPVVPGPYKPQAALGPDPFGTRIVNSPYAAPGRS
ncbi:WXG100 family type VII secretion target [Kitasatospora indigofera]|uniref:WXG100 family type VII secretion target n=1 Tax=Kitasatospora indigofera TaxID=67307 RepID=UPI003652B888